MSKLFEEFLSKLDFNFYDEMFKPLDKEIYESEQFEVTKGQYKTVITVKFNKKGFPVYNTYETVFIGDEDNKSKIIYYNEEMKKSAQSGDYITAAKFQEELNKLKRETN